VEANEFVPYRKLAASRGWVTVGPLIHHWREETYSHLALDPRAWEALRINELVCGWLRGVDRVGVVADGGEQFRSETMQLLAKLAASNAVELDTSWSAPEIWMPGR